MVISKKFQEIFKLKEMLEKAEIPFEWNKDWGYTGKELEEIKSYSPGFEWYQIGYPKLNDSCRVLSAVEGTGTHGSEEDLIEIMGLLTSDEQLDDSVLGYLTAEEVFDRIQNHYEKNNREKKGLKFMKTIKIVNENTLKMETKEVLSDEMTSDEFVSQLRTILNCDPDEFYKKYKKYKKAEADFKAIYEPFKEKLIQLHEKDLDLSNTVIVGGVKLIYVSPSTRTSIDSKKLKEEEPELSKKYSKTTTVGATIRLEEV